MAHVKEGVLYNSKNQAIVPVNEIKIRGAHNIENYLAAMPKMKKINVVRRNRYG